MGELVFALLLGAFVVALPYILIAIAAVTLLLCLGAVLAAVWIAWKALKITIRLLVLSGAVARRLSVKQAN